MELETISDIIDTRLNGFDGGISVDEYEKSIYLTKVQKDFYYGVLKTFEENGIITNILKPFVKDAIVVAAPAGTPVTAVTGSQFFVLPSDVEKIIYETATLTLDSVETRVKHVRAGDMVYTKDNPFRNPDQTETLRVIAEKTSTENLVELHSISVLTNYKIKYFKTIIPIVLETLPTGLSIEGVSAATNTEFNKEVLNKIIDTVVLLILQDKTVQK